jgi:hypothetical protein
MTSGHTYIPQLLFLMNHLYKYISRWQPKLAEHLTEEQFAHLTTCLADLAVCLVAIPEPAKGD